MAYLQMLEGDRYGPRQTEDAMALQERANHPGVDHSAGIRGWRLGGVHFGAKEVAKAVVHQENKPGNTWKKKKNS